MSVLDRAAIAVAGLVLLIMGAIIVVSVLSKLLFVKPVPDDLLMVGLLNVAVIALPLAYVEYNRGHILVTITTDWMGVRALGALRAFGALAMAVFFGGIGYMVSMRMPIEFERGAYYDGVLQIPTWPMKAVFGVGVLLLVLRLIGSIVSGVRTAVTGLDENPHISGTPHEQEEN